MDRLNRRAVPKAGRPQCGLLTYVPQSVFIPPAAGVERQFPAVLGGEDIARCDRRTLFYDLVRPPGHREIVCIGPPFHNLGSPVAILAQGSSVSFAVEKIKAGPPRGMAAPRAISATRVLLDEEHVDRTVDLRFSFREFNVEATCSPTPPTVARGRVELTLSTLQKDNDAQWIRDWCLWHHRAHGVSRVVLYDNDSGNLGEVCENLSGLAGPEIVVVRWNFPHGPYSLPARRIRPLVRFAQVGSLNHCRIVFGRYTDWCLNLDVDEYLYNGGAAPLSLHLQSRKYRNRSVVSLGSYRVPMTSSIEPRRCFDSPLRIRRLHRGPTVKYMYRPERTTVNGIHRAATARWSVPLSAKDCAAELLACAGLFRIGRVLWEMAGRAVRRLDDAGLGSRFRLKEDALFYFHFEALNTGWKRKRTVARRNPRRVVADDRITAMKAVLEDCPPARS